MAAVFAKLNDLGIEPLGAEPQSDTDNSEPLVDRVRRRAEALRAEWLEEKVAVGQAEAKSENDYNSLAILSEGG